MLLKVQTCWRGVSIGVNRLFTNVLIILLKVQTCWRGVSLVLIVYLPPSMYKQVNNASKVQTCWRGVSLVLIVYLPPSMS